MVTLPATGCQTPANAFASVDFPDAEGPAIPIPLPGSSTNDTPRTAGTSDPGAPTTRFEASISARGAGSGVRTGSSGVVLRSTASERRASSARWRIGHCPTAWSIGASARPSRIDDAMMIPGVTSARIASQASRPSIID